MKGSISKLIQQPVFWRRCFLGLLAIYGVVILATFWDYGVTTDEPLHVAYGERIARWYLSGFADYAVFTDSNLWLYGGLFDTVIHLLRQVIPLDVYDLRHLVCALVGMLGVFGAYRVGNALGGPKAGFVAALFLVLTPRFYAHAFNNTKDVPFAVAYLWSLYCLIRCVGALPHLPRHLVWQTGLAIGCALGVRASAALLVMYLGLFFVLRYAQLMWDDREILSRTWRRTLLQVLGIGAVVYAVLFPVYPWMHLYPITGLWDSVTAFASFPEVHYNFFEGRYIASNALPRYYAAKWFSLTLPEFVFLGLIAGAGCLILGNPRRWLRDPKALQMGVLIFAALFPLGYGAIARTPLLNGIRHMTFVIPPLVILSALGTVSVIKRLPKGWAYGLVAAVGCMLLVTLGDLIAMHPNQVVYFNRLVAGGIETASHAYELDYWNNASKQGIRWIERQTSDSDSSVVIGGLYKNIPLMLHDERFKVTPKPRDADFYLGNVWFDHQRAIPGEVLHTIEAKGVPLLYVIRPDSSYRSNPFFDQSPLMHTRLGDYYRARGDLVAALGSYERALDRFQGGFRATWLDSSGILQKMGNVALGLDRLDLAFSLFDQIPKRRLFAGAIANNVGLYFIGKKDYRQALAWLQGAVEVDPDFYNARVSLANLYMVLEDTVQAAAAYRAAAQSHLSEANRQLEVGEYLYSIGYYEDAFMCFQNMIRLRYDNVRGHFLSGVTHSALKQYREARLDFEQVVQIDPDYAGVYYNLGVMCLYLADYEAAVDAFQKAIEVNSDQGDLYTLLGIAYGNLEQYDAAREAFDRALAINPGDVDARQHRSVLKSMIGK